MKISICVPTYNRPDQVEQLLANLMRQQSPPDEILLVDASPDERTREVAKEFLALLPMLKHVNWEKGLTRQRNRAIELAAGDVLVFLDDDIILAPEFIKNLRRLLLADEQQEIAGLTGVLLNEAKKTPGLGWRLKRRLGIVESDQPGRLLACGETTPLPRPKGGQVVRVDFLPGGFTAWRREVFEYFRYSHFFQGYGLGEDKYFSGCVRHRFNLFVSGDLRGEHLHVGGNRPNYFRWGYFNVYNHSFIMQQCSPGDWKRIRFFAFHSIDAVNELLSWPLRINRTRVLFYGAGRLWGLVRCLVSPPRMPADDPARINLAKQKGAHG